MGVFLKYASYYNLLYSDKNYALEVEYVESLIKKHSSFRVNSILNLGCGTGNHDFLFAKKGYNITGIDLSEQMVSVAKEAGEKNHVENADFLCSDIRRIKLEKEFDCVISLFHVMSYQTRNEDLKMAMRSAFEHLKKGGLFVFDCWYGPAVLSDLPSQREKLIENDEMSIHRKARPVIRFNDNTVDVNFDVSIQWKKDGSVEKLNEIHKMRYLFSPELELIYRETGFSLIASHKWLTEEATSEKSWYAVFILEKE